MSATMISDPMVIAAPAETQSAASIVSEVEFAICDCCGLREECTIGYIERIRERYHGKWVCGLCGEAVKDEIVRSERLLSTEEAMTKHMNFCKKFITSGPPTNPTVHLISAMRQILRKSLENSPTRVRSMPTSPTTNNNKSGRELSRSESCFSTLAAGS
ncbi:hypothetical protein HN51_027608 [Arachis hypogaea]|uniref:DUF1677 family protein n=2 Tax=Arachis TaxID=3817 RepID=A0A445BM94_ARAHY|nr:uncharacterized protein LOC107464882 [Arachis duranensis]XP_025618517.1 uncharacterized protein LOC112710493 [Arachis hypogaea]QHO34020.1 uncharacterized protein DS421_9g263330 [Arachis hypogaea]RYR39800.1 hypothetical protein Ahy_A09g045399 [Arachis hypogaea]